MNWFGTVPRETGQRAAACKLFREAGELFSAAPRQMIGDIDLGDIQEKFSNKHDELMLVTS